MIKRISPSEHMAVMTQALGMLLLSTLVSGCFVTETSTKRINGIASGLMATGSSCGVSGFKQMVWPSLKTNCASCHSGSGPGVGSFASGNGDTAYPAANQRANLSAPSSSLLVSKSSQAGHGGGCASCGGAFGSSLAAMIGDWARAESGDSSLCANLASVVDDGGTNTTVRPDDGAYSPPNPNDTIVVPEGLAKYSEAGGVQALMRNNCIQCHIPGGLALFAPFAVADPLTSYREAKPRVNFVDVTKSRIYSRAATPNHGGDCRICGDPSFLSTLTTKLNEWKAVESAGVQNLMVRLNSKLTGINPGVPGQVITLSWNLGTEIMPANSALAGGTFTIKVQISTVGSGTTYRFSDPRIIAPGSTAVQVKELIFVLNGADQPFVSTYRQISTTAPAATNTQLANFAALVPLVDANTDTIGIVFSVLKQP